MRGETPTPHGRWRLCARTARLLRVRNANPIVRPPFVFNLVRRSSRPSLDLASDEVADEEFKKRKRNVAALPDDGPDSVTPEMASVPITDEDGLHFVTASDDEKDLMAAQDYYNLCATGCEPAGPAPSGYWKPIGRFSKEEEVKIYHSMFDHIIGVDGLCVYPHCKKPKEDFDLERSFFLGDRYADCLQENWDELEKSRIALQDAEHTRAMLERFAQNPKPSVPPDPIGPTVPRGKKNRHPKKHKSRALALPLSSGIIREVSDLRRCNYCFLTTHSFPTTDCICNEAVILESAREDLARLAVDSCANCDNTVFAPVPNLVVPTISRAISNPSPPPHPPPLPPPPTTTTTTTTTTTITTTTTFTTFTTITNTTIITATTTTIYTLPRPDPLFSSFLSDVYGNVCDDDDVDSDDCFKYAVH